MISKKKFCFKKFLFTQIYHINLCIKLYILLIKGALEPIKKILTLDL